MDEKKDKDIGIPDISPILSRKQSLAQEIGKIDVMTFNVNRLPMKKTELEATKTFYLRRSRHSTDEKLIEREYQYRQFKLQRKLSDTMLAGSLKHKATVTVFGTAPKIKEFFEHKPLAKVLI